MYSGNAKICLIEILRFHFRKQMRLSSKEIELPAKPTTQAPTASIETCF